MGESACLVRSFSQPAETSLKADEGNPIRALTESISFGRFMSESLAWEKWSTFSHNRYLEEVQKFAKPGSVAQKKAYFEAHYKRRAAMKAAVLLQEAHAAANYVPVRESANKTPEDCAMDAESVKTITHVAIEEEGQKDEPDSEVACCAEANTCNSTVDMGKITLVEGVEAVVDQNIDAENPGLAEMWEKVGKAGNQREVATPKERIPDKPGQGNSTASSRARQRNSLSRLLSHSRASGSTSSHGRQATSAQARSGNNFSSNSRRSSGNVNQERRSMQKSIHMSINFDSQAGETGATLLKMPKERLSPLQARPRTEVNAALNTKKSLGDSNKKKRSIPSSCRTSNHFGSHAFEMNKSSEKRSKSSTTQEAPSVQAINENDGPPKLNTSREDSNRKRGSMPKPLRMSINFASCTGKTGETSKTSVRRPKNDSYPVQKTTRASVSVISKQSSKNLLSEDKRTFRTSTSVNKSVSGGITVNGKWQSSVDHAKSSTSSGGKVQSSISSFPFSFRSEERAAKRREFFKKLEEKNDAKVTEKVQLPARSKMPLMHSSKLGGKPSLSSIQYTCSQPPLRPPSNTESCKHVREKNNQRTTHLSNSLSKRNGHENASPNIQHHAAKKRSVHGSTSMENPLN